MKLFDLEMKCQYIKANSNRQTNCSINSNNQTMNKNQLASRLKVIDFLKDHLYPTGKTKLKFNSKIFLFIRLINIIISNRKCRFISKETFIKSTYPRNSSEIDESSKSTTNVT